MSNAAKATRRCDSNSKEKAESLEVLKKKIENRSKPTSVIGRKFGALTIRLGGKSSSSPLS